MGIVYSTHTIFGERILPIVIVLVAIWLFIKWKPGSHRDPVARALPVLIDIQVTLGLIYYIYGLVIGNPRYLSFPFILHPILGILIAGFGHMLMRPNGPARNLGRWAPVATLGVVLLLVLGMIVLGRLT